MQSGLQGREGEQIQSLEHDQQQAGQEQAITAWYQERQDIYSSGVLRNTSEGDNRGKIHSWYRDFFFLPSSQLDCPNGVVTGSTWMSLICTSAEVKQ